MHKKRTNEKHDKMRNSGAQTQKKWRTGGPPPDGWGPEGWGPEEWGPEGSGARRALSLWSSRGIVASGPGHGLPKLRVWASPGSICEPRRPLGFHKMTAPTLRPHPSALHRSRPSTTIFWTNVCLDENVF